MTKREKILLLLFCSITVITVFFTLLFSAVSELKNAEAAIVRYRTALQKLPEIDSSGPVPGYSESEIVRKKNRLSITEIADIVLVQLQTQGIILRKYQISGSGDSQIVEFSFSCSSAAFIRFLYVNSAEDQFYKIKSLTVKSDTDGVSAVLKIAAEPSYMKSPVQGLKKTEPDLVRLLIAEKSVTETPAVLKNETDVTSEIPQNADGLFKTIGYISGSDGISYLYIKSNASGRVYRLAPNEIIENSEKRYVFKIDETVYVLMKKES